MYASTVLGLPPFINVSDVDPAIDVTLQQALNDVKTDTSLSPDESVFLAATAKHIEVLRIIAKANHALFPKPSLQSKSDGQKPMTRISIAVLKNVEKEFAKWGREAAAFFPDESASDRQAK